MGRRPSAVSAVPERAGVICTPAITRRRPPHCLGVPDPRTFPPSTIVWPPVSATAHAGYEHADPPDAGARGADAADHRRICGFDAQFGAAANYLRTGSPFLTANGGTYNNGNIGDDTPGVVRLRRVWDTWSTEYSDRAGRVGSTSRRAFLAAPPGQPPIYPSYPPPTRRRCGEFRSRSGSRTRRISG